MRLERISLMLCVLLCVSCYSASGNSLKSQEQSIVQVSLRMLGHKILLYAGDSTSKVAPIVKVGDRYRVGLNSEFVFDSGELMATVDTVVNATKLASSYLLELEKCDSDEVEFSYLKGGYQTEDIIPCASRTQEKACYNIYFTILEPWPADLSDNAGSEDEMSIAGLSFLVLGLIALILFGVYFKKSREKSENPDLISIGDYRFDKLNSELHRNDEKVELTSKESDLLLLLYKSANETLGREDILRSVWGDEGDYVGRTLDVFISKLRKKLEVDANVKIVNIRGVGYKLILNENR